MFFVLLFFSFPLPSLFLFPLSPSSFFIFFFFFHFWKRRPFIYLKENNFQSQKKFDQQYTTYTNNDHCHATDKEEIWKFQRKCFKLGINAPLQALMCPDSPLSVALPQCNQPQPLDSFPFPSKSMPPNQVSRPSTIRPCTTMNNYTVPNVISQGRSQQPASILPKNRVHPHLISQQLFGVHQRDRAVYCWSNFFWL